MESAGVESGANMLVGLVAIAGIRANPTKARREISARPLGRGAAGLSEVQLRMEMIPPNILCRRLCGNIGNKVHVFVKVGATNPSGRFTPPLTNGRHSQEGQS